MRPTPPDDHPCSLCSPRARSHFGTGRAHARRRRSACPFVVPRGPGPVEYDQVLVAQVRSRRRRSRPAAPRRIALGTGQLRRARPGARGRRVPELAGVGRWIGARNAFEDGTGFLAGDPDDRGSATTSSASRSPAGRFQRVAPEDAPVRPRSGGSRCSSADVHAVVLGGARRRADARVILGRPLDGRHHRPDLRRVGTSTARRATRTSLRWSRSTACRSTAFAGVRQRDAVSRTHWDTVAEAHAALERAAGPGRRSPPPAPALPFPGVGGRRSWPELLLPVRARRPRRCVGLAAAAGVRLSACRASR